MIVASAFPHFGEEDCLRGGRGSGTICSSLCDLECGSCRDRDRSSIPAGEEPDAEALARVMLHLREPGRHDLATPEHVVPQLVDVVGRYRPEHRVPSNPRYVDLDRRPTLDEPAAAREAARAVGLRRLDPVRRGGGPL